MWPLDRSFYTGYVYLSFVLKLYISSMYLHTQTHTRALQSINKVCWLPGAWQRIWKPGAVRPRQAEKNPTMFSPSPWSSPGWRKNSRTCRQNVCCGRLPPGGIEKRARSGTWLWSWGRFFLISAESQGQELVFAVPQLSANSCISLNGMIWFKFSVMAVL